MEIPMRMALRRAGLALVAAGSLSLVNLGRAQTPTYLPGGETVQEQPAEGQPVEGALGQEAPADGQGRVMEIKVELALMADVSTFPYRLSAQANGEMLEVRGFIPNEVVRQRAMKIARDHCPLTITDGLKIYPRMSFRSGGVSIRELESAVRDALADAFPEAAKQIQVKARANGEVTLTGSIPSFEEKLAVSHCLRKVSGCSAVVNQLKLPTLVKEGMKLSRVSADGEQMVPAELAEDFPQGATSTYPVMQPLGPDRVVSVPPVPGGEAAGAHWVPRKPSGEKAVWVRSSAGSPYAKVANEKSAPGAWRPSSPSPVPGSGHASRETAEETTSMPWEQDPGVLPSTPAPVSGAGEAKAKVKPASHKTDAGEGTGGIVPVGPPASCPATCSGDSNEASGPSGARSMPSAAAKKPAAPAKGSAGVVVFEDDDEASEPEGRPSPASLQARMKQSIEKICADTGRDVEVVVRSANSLLVRLKVKDSTEGARLSQKILKMQELGPYQVNLEIKVAQ
jgi:osmotically-inducible protein OsmY